MDIHFFFEQHKKILTNRTGLKKYIAHIFLKEAKQLSSLNYVFCSDDRLLQINRTYLKHDFYTDVITLNLSCDAIIIFWKVKCDNIGIVIVRQILLIDTQ